MKSKALLLLLILLLNTATGFACALRMSNHGQEEATEHRHEGEQASVHHHQGEEATGHHHEEHQQVSHHSGQQHHVLNGIYIAKYDPCCQGAVSNFNALAKVAPQSNHIVILAPFIYIGMDYQFFLKPVPYRSKANELSSLNERRRPPTYAVRIAIQSFQI